MGRIIKILGIAVVLTFILVVASAGSVFAAGDNPDRGNPEKVCPCGECVCVNCVPNEFGGDCVPDPNEYLGPGPHGKNSE
ncbi:hypothetical protein ACFLUX_00420 [Chloroflexota bacterium]